jgi:hypothetical protein
MTIKMMLAVVKSFYSLLATCWYIRVAMLVVRPT